MKRGLTILVLVSAAVVALDRVTKMWASATLPGRQPVEVIGEFVRLTYTRNSGVAFGIGAGSGFPFFIFSIVAAVAILWMFVRRQAQGLPVQLALSLILGGALGNLFDRVTSGEVVDFIEIGWSHWHWPVFNVADSAVSIGVVLFALTWTRRTEAPHPQSAETHGDVPPAGAAGPGAAGGGAPGSLPGGGADGPLA